MTSPAPVPSPAELYGIAPTGVLRAGINLSNTLLVTGQDDTGRPTGVSPSLAIAMSEAMKLPLELLAFDGPGELVDSLSANQLDIGNVGSDPTREKEIAFTAPYCEIEATFLVRDDSSVTLLEDVDRPGVRIATRSRAAYTLWLDRNIHNAEVIHSETMDAAVETFTSQGLEVLAGLRSRLVEEASRNGEGRVLEGGFASVRQAVGIHKSRESVGLAYLDRFVGWAVASGHVRNLIDRFDVPGLAVARPVEG